MSQDCFVCMENVSSRYMVSCPKCSYSCCRTCVKRFLLGKPQLNPECMSCHTQWDFEFLANNTEEKFHNNTYRNYRAQIRLQMEKSLLPASQYLVPQAKKEKVASDRVIQLNYMLKKMYRRKRRAKEYITSQRYLLKRLDNVVEIDEVRNLLFTALEKKKGYELKIKEIISEKNSLKEKVLGAKIQQAPKKQPRIIGHCPREDCKGFINSHHTCGICEGKVCRKCRQPVEEDGKDHECNPDDVKTVQMLAGDTKPCPSCSVPIFKQSGCSQMFCTNCFKPFDWKTGEAIIGGPMHNPHYFEWRRNGGRLDDSILGNNECGENNLISKLSKKLRNNGYDDKVYMVVLRLRAHITDVTLRQYPLDELNQTDNEDLRVKFLLNDINEKKWVSELKKREKNREKCRAVNLVLTMFCDTIRTITSNIIACNSNDIPQYMAQLDELRSYTSKNLITIRNRFKNMTPLLNDNWDLSGSKFKAFRSGL